MKPCPTCGTLCAEDDRFCELDGTDLTRETLVPKEAGARCAHCGGVSANQVDDYCVLCWYRSRAASPSEMPRTPTIARGTQIGPYEVISTEGGVPLARSALREAVLVFGDSTVLAAEAQALGKLGEPFAHVLDRGYDAHYGAYLALNPLPSGVRKLSHIASSRGIAQIVSLLCSLMQVASHVEQAGYSWLPAPDDVYVDTKGGLWFQRLRNVIALGTESRLDAKSIVESLGSLFLLEPAIHGPSSLVRLLVRNGEYQMSEARSVDSVHQKLRLVEKELTNQNGWEQRKEGAQPCVAALCDQGLWRPYNQDAIAVSSGQIDGEDWVVLVVCDGVSSSSRSDVAAQCAAKTACDVLVQWAHSGDIAHQECASAVAAAIRSAHLAVCAEELVLEPPDTLTEELPGTTIAVAIIYRKRLTIGWLGDSRVYWVTSKGAELLTHDHSWVNEAVARGEMTEEKARHAPLAHAITRCLGPLEVGNTLLETEPDVRSRDLPGPGMVMLCSDGLWNYVQNTPDLASLVSTAKEGASADTIAHLLMNYALAQGGQDNISIIVYAYS